MRYRIDKLSRRYRRCLFPLNLREKQKIIESRYHQTAKQFELQYELIHRRVISRFHRESTEIDLPHSIINHLITKSTASINHKINSKRKKPLFSITSTKILDNFCYEKIDWTRGRFSGKTIKIYVHEGKIVEKIFLTPQGNRISVKRSELG